MIKKYYTLHGRTATASEWAKLVGISRQAMSQRLSKVGSPEELEAALTQEDKQGKSPKPNGNRRKRSKRRRNRTNPTQKSNISNDSAQKPTENCTENTDLTYDLTHASEPDPCDEPQTLTDSRWQV